MGEMPIHEIDEDLAEKYCQLFSVPHEVEEVYYTLAFSSEQVLFLLENPEYIIDAFDWSIAPQGYSFWSKEFDKAIENKKLSKEAIDWLKSFIPKEIEWE